MFLDAHASQAPGLSLSQSLSQSVSHKDRIFTNLTILLLAISQTYLRHISDISPIYLTHILAIFEPYLRHISDIPKGYLRHIKGISQLFLRYI